MTEGGFIKRGDLFEMLLRGGLSREWGLKDKSGADKTIVKYDD